VKKSRTDCLDNNPFLTSVTSVILTAASHNLLAAAARTIQYCLFDHCAGRNANLLVRPVYCRREKGRPMLWRVDRRRSVTGELKETGLRLLTSQANISTLYRYAPYAPFCGYRFSTGPAEGLSLLWPIGHSPVASNNRQLLTELSSNRCAYSQGFKAWLRKPDEF